MTEVILPFDDEYMTYDLIKHRYVLTEKYMLDNYGENLSIKLYDDGTSQFANLPLLFLKRVSNYFYEMIYMYSQNRRLTEYMLAKDLELRQSIEFCLGEMAMHMLSNGDIGIMAGVNFDKGSAMNIGDIRNERMYPVIVMQFLKSSGLAYLGRVRFSGSMDYVEDNY